MARNGHGGYYSSSVVNAGESEGSDSSGRVDMEITASENFSFPMRKCINLNPNKQDVFDVPTQVVSIAGISQAHRKGLLVRLRAELEQILDLQNKIGRRTNCPPFPSSSNILSGNNTQNGNQTENLRRSSMDASGSAKRLSSQNSMGHGSKRGASGKFESSRLAPVPSSSSLNLMRQCESLLKRLMSHQFGWVFNTPVDVVKLNLPDYFTVIKHPMDLGTIKGKLASGVYCSPLEFLADVRLTFSNAMTYNPPGNDVNIMADTMSKFFETRWKSIEKKIPVTDFPVVPESSGISEGAETANRTHPSKRRKIISLQHHVIPEPIVERIMTDAEKLKLGRELESLLAEIPDRIVDFLRENSSNGRETGDDEIEIDIDEFSDEALFTLRKLLDDFLEEKAKIHAKGEPCEIELLNEPGLSNSSMQPCQGAVDEDVDIGGNEPPVSSYPPIEIEKDSENSFDGEADGAKASIPAKVLDPVETETRSDGKASGDVYINGNKSISGADQVEVKFQHNPNSVDSDRYQDGDSAATESQVSPNKLYRAALLKNRFADTILKAREKTLVQGEVRDPEKLRREKEELEIQRRKAKARLQAEAKAAEDARRRAEAEVVAEAKRKREVEREAARQALLKIEKTVEINENSRFLKDLEMLRAAPLEPLPIPVNEMSPDDSHDGLGGFKFGGSNPLEQLGLYMRKDDEEEEGEPHDIPNPLQQLGLYMKKDDGDEKVALPGNPSNLEQLGLFMKNADDKEEDDPPSFVNPLEQFGLYLNKDDDEDEDGEVHRISNPLEQLGLYLKNDEEEKGNPPILTNPLEQLGLYMKNDEEEEEEGELPSIPNTSEQHELCIGKDDAEEQADLPSIPNTSEQLDSFMGKDDEEEPGELLSVPNTSEQLGSYTGKEDTEKPGEPPVIANTSEQHGSFMGKGDEEGPGDLPINPSISERDVLSMGKDDVKEQVEEPPSIPSNSELLGLYTGNDDGDMEEPAESRSIPNTLELVELSSRKDDDGENQGEPFSISNTLDQLPLCTENYNEDEVGHSHIHANTSKQLGLLTKKNDAEESEVTGKLELLPGKDDYEERVDLPSIPKTSEQLQLYNKKDDEEQEGELPTVPNPSEQDAPHMKNDDAKESEVTSIQSPLKQLELPTRKDDDEEQVEPPSIPNTSEQVEPPSIPNTSEQVEPPSIPNTPEQVEPPSIPNTSEQVEPPSILNTSEQVEPPSIPNTSEQLQLYNKKDDEEKGELPPTVPYPSEQDAPLTKNDDAKQSEVTSIQSLDYSQKNEDEANEQLLMPPNPSEQLGLSTKKNEEFEGEPGNVLNLKHDEQEDMEVD